ncbi:hypothetical protein [Mesorhizobium sp. B2-3-4]|uniref:hypothetical protein n=1 Tax=Mesorhizobium sp. B2-3-4 TaxID=2589959 RepID=UPI001129C469|nr:hypothetical protein [Mesorhizobium sp. B2-3-4]TPM41438.1 hypothetical protein FJ967_00430 [Mesorhizobium sp. B2-3-4]
MARKALIGDTDVLFVVAGLAWCANYMTVRWWHYPYLYCWFAPPFRYVWEPLGQFVYLVTLGGFIIGAFSRRWNIAIFNIVIMLMVLNAPVAADTVFRLGGSCG